MKHLATFLLFAAFAAGTSHVPTHEPAHPLVGSWVMVSQKIVHPDRVEEPLKMGETLPGDRRQVKILTESHFAFGRQSENGEDLTAGGGSYVVKGDTYTEVIEYHTSAPLVGSEIPFIWRVEGDLWYHSGQIGTFRLEEVYQRIE